MGHLSSISSLWSDPLFVPFFDSSSLELWLWYFGVFSSSLELEDPASIASSKVKSIVVLPPVSIPNSVGHCFVKMNKRTHFLPNRCKKKASKLQKKFRIFTFFSQISQRRVQFVQVQSS